VQSFAFRKITEYNTNYYNGERDLGRSKMKRKVLTVMQNREVWKGRDNLSFVDRIC
jgi:hypothetical protein